MLSKILEMQNGQMGIQTKERVRPAPFPKKEKHAPLSKNLKENSLKALKDILAKQKEQMLMSAAHPFQELPSLEAVAKETSLKIDASAQVMQLYHKMVETLLHLHREGIDETTFFLDGDAFSSSLFHGAKITITEYSTAPKVFNIHFSADPKALSVFEAHAGELVNALKNGNFGFSIHRLDTSLLTDPLLPKVEGSLDKEEEPSQ